MNTAQLARLNHFRGAYGRLCALSALALTAGETAGRVQAAARGNGTYLNPVLRRIAKQRERVNRALAACVVADVTRGPILEAGRDVKRTIEGEFMLKIPVAER